MDPINPILMNWLEAGSYLATLLGIPIAIIVFRVERKKDRRAQEEDRRAQEEQIYLSPNLQYIEYLKLCLEHPDLDIFDLISPSERTPDNVKRERIAFTILASIMEQAFLLYRNHPQKDNKQWKGWTEYIQWWMTRPNFYHAWKESLANQLDSDFVDYVNGLPLYKPRPSLMSSEWMSRDVPPVPVASVPRPAASPGVPSPPDRQPTGAAADDHAQTVRLPPE